MLRDEWRLFWLAVVYFTRLPAPRALALGEVPPERAIRYFPLAGALAALPAAVLLVVAAQCWSPWIAAALALAALAWLTGALHEDGLADTFDGLGGGRDAATRLEIMRDSRLGSFGALALLLTLLLKAAALAQLLGQGALWAAALWWAVQGISRALAAALMLALPYARAGQTGKVTAVARSLRRSDGGCALAVGGVAWLLLAALAWPWRALVVLAVLALLYAVWRRVLRARLGGYTGDALGAAQQVAELALLLVLAAGA